MAKSRSIRTTSKEEKQKKSPATKRAKKPSHADKVNDQLQKAGVVFSQMNDDPRGTKWHTMPFIEKVLFALFVSSVKE